MLKTSGWEEIEYSDAPEEVKEFARRASTVEQKLNFSNLVLRKEGKRAVIRRKLIDAEDDIQLLLKTFNNFIQKGYSEKNDEEVKNTEQISKVLKGLWGKMEEAKWSKEIGLTDENPIEAPIQMYSNYLSKILRELIFSSLLEASREGEGEYYETLFESVQKWCKIQSFTSVKAMMSEEEKLEEREVEEGEGEPEEGEERPSDEIVENVGKIS